MRVIQRDRAADVALAPQQTEAYRARNELVDEFPREESPTADALWFADMTTGPDGEDLDVLDRLAEIRRRNGRDDPVTASG